MKKNHAHTFIQVYKETRITLFLFAINFGMLTPVFIKIYDFSTKCLWAGGKGVPAEVSALGLIHLTTKFLHGFLRSSRPLEQGALTWTIKNPWTWTKWSGYWIRKKK